MADPKLYWQRVKQTEQKLREKFPGDEIWLTSVENLEKGVRADRVCSADPELAAQRIVDGTHRLATPEEVQAFRTHLEEQRERIRNRDEAMIEARIGRPKVVVMQAPAAPVPAAQPQSEPPPPADTPSRRASVAK